MDVLEEGEAARLRREVGRLAPVVAQAREPGTILPVGALGVVADGEIARLRGELERLRAENARLSRLLDLRGQDTAPAPEQLSAAVAPPGLVAMSSPLQDKLALYADRFRARPTCMRCGGRMPAPR